MALLSDNSYAVLYNPQPETRELQTARQIAEGIDTSDGARVNPHIFGVHVAPFGYNIIQPFFVTTIREDGRTLNGTVPVDTHEASPLLKVVNNILSNGRVGLPKRYKPAPDAL